MSVDTGRGNVWGDQFGRLMLMRGIQRKDELRHATRPKEERIDRDFQNLMNKLVRANVNLQPVDRTQRKILRPSERDRRAGKEPMSYWEQSKQRKQKQREAAQKARERRPEEDAYEAFLRKEGLTRRRKPRRRRG